MVASVCFSTSTSFQVCVSPMIASIWGNQISPFLHPAMILSVLVIRKIRYYKVCYMNRGSLYTKHKQISHCDKNRKNESSMKHIWKTNSKFTSLFMQKKSICSASQIFTKPSSLLQRRMGGGGVGVKISSYMRNDLYPDVLKIKAAEVDQK